MMELNQEMMENLEIEKVLEEEPIALTEDDIKNRYNSTIKYLLDLTKGELKDEMINDIQKEDLIILSNEEDFFLHSANMIRNADNNLIIISNDYLVHLIQVISEFAYQNAITKFFYLTSADLEPYEGINKAMNKLGNIQIDGIIFEPEIFLIIRDFKRIIFGKDDKFTIKIKDEKFVKKFIPIIENALGLEKPFNRLVKESLPEVEERILDKEQESTTHFLYTAMFKNIYSEDNLPSTTVEQIIDKLINNPTVGLRLPNVLDYKETKHPVRFRDALENTRKDLTIYFAVLPDGFESEKFGIVVLDIVSFFTKTRDISVVTEHKIYRIGEPRLLDDEPTFNIVFNLAKLYYEQNNINMAKKLYEMLLEEYPDNAKIKDQLKKLATK